MIGDTNMKKRLFALLGVLLVLTVALTGCTVFSGSAAGRLSITKAASWTITASSVNGHESRKVNMSADNLAALKVVSTNNEGTVSLVITEGDNTRTVDISGQYSGNIDTSGFTAGKINLRLNYEKVKDANIIITW